MSEEKEDKKEQAELPPSRKYENPERAIHTENGFQELGKSAGGHPITYKVLPGKKGRALLVGGVHGNETEGVAFMEGFVKEFCLDASSSPANCEIVVLPVLNPDGFLNYARQNANGVDLNRNMRTKDWQAEALEPKYYPGKAPDSEPETRALLKLIEMHPPDFIISFHSWKPMVNVNGPAHAFADVIAKKLNYIITEDIGYPTPGSLGTWAGWERSIPTITLEFERGIDLSNIYSFARNAILSSLELVHPAA